MMEDKRSVEAKQSDQEKMGKLPGNSFYLLEMLKKKRPLEKRIQDTFENRVFTGYHLHCSAFAPNALDVHENQLHIFVKDGLLCTRYRDAKGIQEVKLYRMQLENNYDVIKKKLSKDIPLTSHEVNDVMNVFKTQKIPTIPVPILAHNKHPLLQTMDDYIVSMQRKQKGGYVNVDMAKDKIEFTKTLRTFVENPTETHWHQVRQAMHAYPRYGFSWRGMSQADHFLTMIKIQHKDRITSFDESYANNKTEANTSWGRFVYNFGFAYYIPSFFLALYKLVQFIYHEGTRQYYHYQLNDLRQDTDKTLRPNSPHKKKVDEIIKNLEAYLSEDDLNVTEEVVAYIDDIDEHIKELKNNGTTHKDKNIEALAEAVKQLIPRPIPLRDMSYLTPSTAYR